MVIEEAQADMRRAYVDGGPGVFISGAVWLIAAGVLHLHGPKAGFAALFLGGMLIFPLSKLATRFAFGRANEAKGNPLAATALESTIAMIGGLVVAWLFLPLKPVLAFPVAGIAVGTRYAVFKTVYGDAAFWIVGAAITVIAAADIFVKPLGGAMPILVGATELIAGTLLTIRAMRRG